MADVIQRVCDACARDDAHTPVKHSVRVVVASTNYRLDLCQEHWESLWMPVAALFEVAVSERAERYVSNEQLVCPDCGQPWNTVSSLSRHRNTEHGFVAYDPGTGCPYCIRQQFNSRQVLSAHIYSQHQEDHLVRLTTERARSRR